MISQKVFWQDSKPLSIQICVDSTEDCRRFLACFGLKLEQVGELPAVMNDGQPCDPLPKEEREEVKAGVEVFKNTLESTPASRSLTNGISRNAM